MRAEGFLSLFWHVLTINTQRVHMTSMCLAHMVCLAEPVQLSLNVNCMCCARVVLSPLFAISELHSVHLQSGERAAHLHALFT